MSSEVKGHDVNFVYRGESFHINIESLNEEKIQILRDLGIECYGENEKYCFYIPEEKRVIGYVAPLPEKNKLSLKVVNEITDFSYIFSDREELTSLDVSGWDVSNGENFKNMFNDCEKLTSLDVSNWDVSNGISFRAMFNCCKNLTSLDVSNWDVSNGENFDFMFSDCKNLTSLDVSHWDVSNGKNFDFMFSGCENLTSLDLSNWDVSSGINFIYMFSHCENLTSLDVSNWDVSNGENFYRMFSDCKNLTSLNLSGWKINQNAVITGGMFLECNSLKEVKAVGCDEYTISVLKEQLPKNCKLVTKEAEAQK